MNNIRCAILGLSPRLRRRQILVIRVRLSPAALRKRLRFQRLVHVGVRVHGERIEAVGLDLAGDAVEQCLRGRLLIRRGRGAGEGSWGELSSEGPVKGGLERLLVIGKVLKGLLHSQQEWMVSTRGSQWRAETRHQEREDACVRIAQRGGVHTGGEVVLKSSDAAE